MTRSIFDPTGGETERSGSPMLGPDAANISHMPPDVTDGEARDAARGAADVEAAPDERADELPQDLATDSTEAARRLGQMTESAPNADQPLDEMPPPAGA
jgi:hypothetical protein